MMATIDAAVDAGLPPPPQERQPQYLFFFTRGHAALDDAAGKAARHYRGRR